MSAATISVNLVAADRPVWSGEAKGAVIPAESGAMGILLNHEPVLTVIKKGEIRLTPVEGEELRFNVDDGFAAFDANKLTIAVERCTAEAEKALHESAEAEQQ
ncbi:MAG: F0F1 ATP synthase subunit epsilon [Bifidobacteriaceae bacterium]|jgi:F-type H+-transporting ATPase subunit epsilon|nr:F0F1 ATP synthase subunit epsilon [Bifidobacteriaceae bacterium]